MNPPILDPATVADIRERVRRVGVLALADSHEELRRLYELALERIADQSEPLSRRAERPTLADVLATATDAELHAAKLWDIPREQRARLAADSAAAHAAYEAEYEKQGRGK